MWFLALCWGGGVLAIRVVSFSDEEILFLKNSLSVNAFPSKWDLVRKICSKLDRSQRRITNASAKAKGMDLQKWVCEKVAQLLGVRWDNRWDESPVASRPSGQHGCDVILRGGARKRFPWDLECKAMKELRIADAVKQAESNVAEGRFPAVVYRQTGAAPVVVMSWETFEAVNKKLL
jgi:hypothetical protein